MNKIRQHRPAFFSGWENEIKEFDTLEELLAIPFVKNFSTVANFHKYSICEDSLTLMAEYEGGKKWFVIGYLDKKVDLPIWEGSR